MEPIFAAIAIALGPGATTAERQRGAVLCRALADQLDPRPGGPPPHAPREVPTPDGATAPAVAPAVDAPAAPAATNPFAGLTADQIFDLAITKLRGAVGHDDAPPAPLAVPFRIPLVPIPRPR
jgi:hypothetical protein